MFRNFLHSSNVRCFSPLLGGDAGQKKTVQNVLQRFKLLKLSVFS